MVNNIGEGEYVTENEFELLFNNNNNDKFCDIVVAISPQHKRLSQLFIELGFEYVIGVQPFTSNDKFDTTDTSTFLRCFYRSLIKGEPLNRAFTLAKCVLTSSLNKYVLYSKWDKIIPYIIFPLLQNTTDDEKDDTDTALSTNINIVRPFVGRAKEVNKLLHILQAQQVAVVHGRNLDGRSSIAKMTVHYLKQRNHFEGGCFLIDCVSLNKNEDYKDFNDAVISVFESCGMDFNDYYYMISQNNNNNNNNSKSDNVIIDGIEMSDEEPIVGDDNNDSTTSSSTILSNDNNDNENGSSGPNSPIHKEKDNTQILLELLRNKKNNEPLCIVISNFKHWRNPDDVLKFITIFMDELYVFLLFIPFI